jgi:PGF-pre-PGF domain-containing protein
VNSTTLNITYNLTETNVNTTYINVSYSNGTLVNSTSSSSSGIVSVSLTVPGDGNYNISLTTYDKVSRSNSTTINNVTVDTISPVLNATYPVSNSYLNSSVLTINFTVTETNLNNTNVSVLNSTGGIVNSTLNTSTGAISVNLTVLADGVYNVTLLTRDLGARTASATISNLTVDTTSPVITGVALNRSIMQNNTPVLVSVNYTESNFKNATAQGTLMTCSNGSCSVTINLTSGTSPLNVTVCDYANHCTTNNAVTFIIDNTVPAVNTATLSDYYVSTGQSVVVTVNATDANGVASVTANGVALTQQGGGAIWNGTINLTGSTGPANATVVATDNASNTNTTYIAYTMDNVAPVITVNSPTNGSTVSDVSGNLTLNYTVVEAQIISSNVSIDGGVFTNSTTSNGTTLFNFTGIAAGTHTIVINAYDNASLSSTSTTTFVMSRPVNATAALATMQTSVGNATLTNITLSDVATNTNQSGNQTLNVSQPLKLEMGINASTTGANVTVTIPAFTGTDANWNATTFNITTNLTGNVALNTSAHTGSSIIALVSFVNMSNFLSNTAYTNGTTVVFQYALTSGIDVLYLADDVGNVVYKLGTCPGSVPPATVSSATMCYLNTSTTVTAYIPHLSGAALSNDTLAPTVNITSPATNLSTVANSYLTFSFDAWEANPNATRFCWYNLTNASNAQIRTANLTTASFTQVGTKYNFSTLFSALPNLAYNITVNCTDQNGNSSQVRYVFTIADTTAPAVTAISATTSGSTVTLSVTTDEAAECRFATTDIAWSSMLNMTTTNSTTHSNAIAYNADASGTYYVRCNDTAGNAMTSSNSTLFSVTVGGGSSCSPSWSCTEWTTCSASSNQVRTCTDANSCGTTVSKPSESQYCIYNAPATCTGTCGLGYYQQPYPGCACVLLACSNTCPTGQTRNVYPDCTCVSPPTNVTPPGDVTVVATRGGAIIRIPSIAAERRSSVSISAVITGATGILDISIVPRRDLAGLKIEFAKLDAKPSSVPNPPNTAYRYYEIKAENVTESDLENATITFQISKTFIGTKYNASSVAMMRHTSAGWATLDTRLISQTTSDYIFEATTPGFSYFAITVAEMGAPPIVITPQGNVTNETGTTVPPIEIGTIAIWVIGIVVAAGIIAFAYQKVNSQKKWKPKSK